MKNKHHDPGPVVLDVEGLVLNAADKKRILHPLTGGVILFGRNFKDRAQLTKLTKDIHDLRPDVLISIDHEGGRVQRARTDGFTHLPAMGKLGALWDKGAKGNKQSSAANALLAMNAATAVGYILAAELRACGVDFSFTPVIDLDYGRSKVIGDRSFSGEPSIVAALSKSINHGLLMAGMKNCGKHFPGHGWAEADSHVAIPVDERPLENIIAKDAQPYADLGIALDSVMPAHVIYPKVDKNPAGFSKVWLQDILRKRFGFTGVIFSDDLSMEGASVAGSVVNGAQMALKAGCDSVLICNRPDLADQLLNNLKVDQKSFALSQERIKRLFPRGEALSWNALQSEAEYKKAKQLLQSLGLIA